MNRSFVSTMVAVLFASTICAAQAANKPAAKPKSATKVATTTDANVCEPPAPGPKATDTEKQQQPDLTADLPSVVQTLEKALECYQAVAQKDSTQPKGLPRLSSAVMDFKTTTGKTVGFTFSVFVFKIGASREKDVTDDLSFTYSVPKVVLPRDVHGFVKTKPTPPPLYAELVKEVQAAAIAAETQSTALGMPLSKVGVTVSFGIKFDGNASISVPVQLVTIGGNGDYNKNNTQSITLTFGQSSP